ncbi:MalY/PatB family protein [Amycolatopsis sp. NPDC059090]|uniref:MalY/PatB family protein n=1 Tax=unclassified Amycolatopsis TaxID=2618356 RepID=UPI0036724603
MTDTHDPGFAWDLAKSRERRTKRWSVYGPDVLDLTVAEMDLPIAEPILAVLRDAVERQTFGYPIPAAQSGLPETAAKWLTETHGLTVDPGEIRLLPELMKGITNALREFTAPGSAVIVPTPTYRSFFGAISLADREAVQVPLLKGHRLDYDRIDAAFAAGAGSLLLCHPANPVGRIFSPPELRQLAEIAERHGGRVISDEVHAPLRYGVDFVPYAAVSETARRQAVTLFSASKAWNIAGLRCGFVALTNPDDCSRWDRLPGAASGGISPLGMVASAAAFEHGAPWLERALAFLDANRLRLAAQFAAAGLPEVYQPADATYLGWLDLRRLGLADPAQLLREKASVAVTAGPDHGTSGAGFVRLNYATEPDVLADAAARIIQVLE